MKHLLQCILMLLSTATGLAGEVTILTPPGGEKAYQIAGKEFASLWEKVTGRHPVLRRAELDQKVPPAGDVVLIGSDAVHPLVHRLIQDAVLDGLDLQYGGDNYRMLAVPHEGRDLVILAGGNGRSTIYAVYDFFRRQAGAEYFWDGDRIPRRNTIELAGLDVFQKPHFGYRGLRYFAHRGLHRFQAEHWDWDDWRREIDWLLKKRFNLFMLRTGIDDLFQRAFPGEVTYPPSDGQDPDAEDRSYNDRTSFWALRYRGELRKQVLQYARDRGLMHPEDTGTITHWYSHTRNIIFREPQFRLMRSGMASLTPARLGAIDAAHRRVAPELKTAPMVLERLAGLSAKWHADEFWRRDALDIARTVANRALFVSFAQGAKRMEVWRG